MRLLPLSPVTALVAAVDVETQDTPSPTLGLPLASFAEQAIIQAVYERLQSPSGNAVGLSTVGFSNNCLCESDICSTSWPRPSTISSTRIRTWSLDSSEVVSRMSSSRISTSALSIPSHPVG